VGKAKPGAARRPTMRRLAVCLIFTTWRCFVPDPINAQTAMPLPSACAAVIDSIVHQHAAPDQFAGLRNSGTILCFSELAPPELQLSASLQNHATAQKGATRMHTGAPERSNMLTTPSPSPKTFTPTPLSTRHAGRANPTGTDEKLAGIAVNRAQENIVQALNHLQSAGADLEAWSACIKTQFMADQILEPSVQTSRFFKHWTQIVGIVFRSRRMNCNSDVPVMQENTIHALWPTRAERDGWEKKFEGFTSSDVKSEQRSIYWRFKLLNAIVEYHAALKLFKIEADPLSAAPISSAGVAVPVAMRPPAPCKISSEPPVSAAGRPITINLCKDTQGGLATAVQFATVTVYDDDSGNEISAEPTSLRPNSFVLTLQPGIYDIDSTVGPASDANSKPVVFLYESCANAAPQLCAFFTAFGPGSSFLLKVN
jgi:hypothetical protein